MTFVHEDCKQVIRRLQAERDAAIARAEKAELDAKDLCVSVEMLNTYVELLKAERDEALERAKKAEAERESYMNRAGALRESVDKLKNERDALQAEVERLRPRPDLSAVIEALERAVGKTMQTILYKNAFLIYDDAVKDALAQLKDMRDA